jgi:hypothetical protein
MRYFHPLCAVCALSILSGCVASANLPDTPEIDIVDVLENIECEIQASLLDNLAAHYWLLGWATTITLDLETDNDGSGTGEVTVSVPLTSELFSLTLSGGPTKDRKRGGTFSYSTYFADIAERSCSADSTEKKKSVLTGRTGAGGWLTRVAHDAANASICPNDIDFGIEFTITMSGNGTPTITGIQVGDGTLDASLAGTGSHARDHELTFSAVPIATTSMSRSGQQTSSRVFSKASRIVLDRTGVKVGKTEFQKCTPLDPALAVAQREQVDDATKDDLDRAVAGQLLRSISPSGPSSP